MSPKYPLMYNNITREGLDALIAYLQEDEPTSDLRAGRIEIVARNVEIKMIYLELIRS